MPPAPKTKKAGAPKAKGAVRAKSGCYTCRIRRKKCDENPNDAGHCQTCVRLRLECLGFGAKRPDWLRENRNVVELREKIKTFLAAQGMIKGHSGSGPRSTEQETPMLRLNDDYSSSTESPPTPTLSLSSNEAPHRGLNTSAVRDLQWLGPPYPPSQSGLSSSHIGGIREESPYGTPPGSSSYHNDMLYNNNTLPPINLPSNSLVATPWLNSHGGRVSPALRSTFGALYAYNSIVDEYPYETELDPSIGFDFYSTANHNLQDELVDHYMQHVVRIQYLLADDSVAKLIHESVQRDPIARDAVKLLSAVHFHRIRTSDCPVLETPDSRIRSQGIMAALRGKEATADAAMAALHVVSAILFDGGMGGWQFWLSVAYAYVRPLLYNSRYGPAHVLYCADETTRFIVKTTMWFDVLASITTHERPYLLDIYRDIFNPTGSRIEDASSPPPELSMKDTMGCENRIVWALAEASALACWKRDQIDKGSLSMPLLVSKAREIESHLGSNFDPKRQLLGEESLFKARDVTSEIFRASTCVYLRSIVSGDCPSVPEIKEGVRETIERLKLLGDVLPSSMSSPSSVSSSVIRSTVFSIFICGCLTDDREQRKMFLEHLKQQGNVGNCNSVRELMEKVWKERDHSPVANPVPWREALKKSSMLLV